MQNKNLLQKIRFEAARNNFSNLAELLEKNHKQLGSKYRRWNDLCETKLSKLQELLSSETSDVPTITTHIAYLEEQLVAYKASTDPAMQLMATHLENALNEARMLHATTNNLGTVTS